MNVFLCHKNSSQGLPSKHLDPLAIDEHIHRITDAWYRIHDPFLTPQRRSQIEHDFHGRQHVTLSEAYLIMFTLEEREQLDYELFLEDWYAFHENHQHLSKETLSFEAALQFLEEMQ